ncbi:hypothetical protein KY284_017006 [Solanum tuberosum]|nr:hypothetical protein KY284_017006 [Solanum tuberosum]
MKKCISNILSFLLVSSLVAFSHEFSISDNNGNVVSPPVLDMDGEPLKIDEDSGEFDNNTPVLFYTMKLGSHFVSENQDVSIKFSTSSSSTKSCVNETVWKVGYSIVGPTHSPLRFVITGGTLGFPGPNNIDNWFKIEKYETGRPHSYKLRYCPSQYICPTCQFDCADVGLYENKGYARLALNNKPYPFGFTKVNKNDA